MDKIIISELSVETIIGTYDWERQLKQKIVLDIEIETDIHGVASEDDLRKTIDYSTVAKKVVTFIGSSQFQLIETLAEKTASFIKNEFQVPLLRLRVTKQNAVTDAKSVSLVIER